MPHAKSNNKQQGKKTQRKWNDSYNDKHIDDDHITHVNFSITAETDVNFKIKFRAKELFLSIELIYLNDNASFAATHKFHTVCVCVLVPIAMRQVSEQTASGWSTAYSLHTVFE